MSENKAYTMRYPPHCEFLSDPLHVPGKFPSLQGPDSGSILWHPD